MDDVPCPPELSPEEWLATPPGVRALLLTLREQVAVLTARLNQHSGNSSKPPSSDPPSAPPRLPTTPRGKPKGAQVGHPDQRKELVPSDQVDTLTHVRPSACPHCMAPLADTLPDAQPVTRQQVWDIPLTPATVTEYQYHAVACPCCTRVVRAVRLEEVPPGGFAPLGAALVAALHGRFRLADREIPELLHLLFGLPISVGSTAHLQQTVSTALAPLDAEVATAVAAQTVANVDETTWKVCGKRAWVWVAVTAVATRFHLDPSRGAKVLPRLLGTDFAGVVGSDRARMYNRFAPERRQICWAHLIRNLRGLADHSPAFAAWAGPLLDQTATLFTHWHAFRAGQIDRAGLQTALQPIQQAMWEALTAGQQQPNGIASFCNDLVPRWAALWTFSQIPGVEPTNNAAERAVRPAVLWRKGCFGTQSAVGSTFVARMLTVIATAKQHGRNLLDLLTRAVRAHWFGTPVPTLLPAT
jgi:transposase